MVVASLAAPAFADDVLSPGTPELDRPTLTALGVRLPFAGDGNGNAAVSVRYRDAGEETWRDALPLYRVRPGVVHGWNVVPNFSGSIFDLRPATTYEIELHAVDPDGPVDQVFVVSAATRAIPADPAAPNPLAVSDTAGFAAVSGKLKAGDVVTLADGIYAGPFTIRGEGTAENPIVVRGASQEGVIVDGGGGTGNALEVYGGFIHIERLTIRNKDRAMRFQTQGAEGNVVRRVRITGVRLGIGSKEDQKDFYIADNIVEGRLAWPFVYTDNKGANANDDGIRVQGNGHVVAHNLIRGFGDAMKVEQDGSRAVDFYGNEVLSAYDNGVELDGAEGNARCLRNRFTNTYATLSVQPVFGGPAYLIRNVVVNVAHEQMKFHALGTVPPQEPSGVFAWHNTFVSPGVPLLLYTSDWSHHFALQNNLFVGPAALPTGRVIDWTGPVDDGVFDYNGYFPDGMFVVNLAGQGGYQRFQNFADMQASGMEAHGVLLAQPVFASGLTPPASYQETLAPQDAALAPDSNAIDRGLVLPNVNDWFTGAAPDLGALEAGCAPPVYGPRPEGVDESNQPSGCAAPGEAPPDSEPGAIASRRAPVPLKRP